MARSGNLFAECFDFLQVSHQISCKESLFKKLSQGASKHYLIYLFLSGLYKINGLCFNIGLQSGGGGWWCGVWGERG